ncbi:hypothetical protein OBV_34670 [Oscillibacter valericigenes Sjm18-20]|nr:hypothetical protein OBV_34670 [Oscillibacter valericigenes Sjm18-20]
MDVFGEAKSARLLYLYSQLTSGAVLSKAEMAQHFHVTQRSIQRDMESLRYFFAEQQLEQTVVYDRQAGGYRLEGTGSFLNNSEILAVCKILLGSRSLVKGEMLPILDKLIQRCIPPENRQAVQSLVSNEKFHYIAPHHGQTLLDSLWQLGQAVEKRWVVEIDYEKLKGSDAVTRSIEPVGLLFSEFYFYLVGFIRDIDKQAVFENPDDLSPTIYRVDRIRRLKVTTDHFRVPYKDRFEEGEFRKRVQFMYGGNLQRIKFKYTGLSIEAVLDRLPTAKIVSHDETGWVVTAEVFGKGIEMWLRSQGSTIKIIN